MTDPLGMPAPTGVRVAGDEYQWLHVWRDCLRMIREQTTHGFINPGIAVGMEISGAGNLDDLVYYRATGQSDYSQVKYAVSANTPVNLAYLSEDDLLRRVVRSYQDLLADGKSPRVLLITNREIDPTDALASARDSRDGRLVPRGAEGGPRSKIGQARAAWAKAADVSEPELIEFFADFYLRTSVSSVQVREEISLLMATAGLESDDAAIGQGVAWVVREVIKGTRKLDFAAVKAAIASINITMSPPWTALSVATLVHDTNGPNAKAALDWVDQFDGESPGTKVVPKSPDDWNTFAAALGYSIAALSPDKRILVSGSYRQATSFKIGSDLSQVKGYSVATLQRGQLWSSEAGTGTYTLQETGISIGAGNDIALILEIATSDIGRDATSYIARNALPVDRAIILRPGSGIANPNAVSGPEIALEMAVAIRDAARRHGTQGNTIHLFLGGPVGLALLVGHLWNRVARTVAYEHIDHDSYVAAFNIEP